MKSALRAEMRRRREEVSASDREDASHRLCLQLAARADVRAAISRKDIVCVYLASSVELSLNDLLSCFLAIGTSLVAPRWNGTAYELAALSDLGRCVAGPMNILEPPPDAPSVSPADVGLWIVPGLAFTRTGVRLGYGGGWYDRLLAQAAPTSVSIGVAYDFQIVESLPAEPHDCCLNDVVAVAAM